MGAEPQDNTSLLGIPASATLAMRLVSAAARPAGWADRIAARTRPLIAVGFGAQMMRRFDTTHSPGSWASTLASRFAARTSQSSGAELPLAPGAQLQRQLGQARWSGPSWPTSPPAPSAPPAPNVAPATEPLLGDLAALGWAPTAASGPPPAPTPIVVPRPAPAPPATQRSADPLAPPALQRSEDAPAAQSMDPDTADLPEAQPGVGRAADMPASPPAQRPNAAPLNPSDQAASSAADMPASPPAQRPNAAPALPGAISRTVAARPLAPATIRRSAAGAPAGAPQNAAARAESPLAALDLPIVRTAATRPPGLIRRMPPNPLERMGITPPELLGQHGQVRRIAGTPPSAPLVQPSAGALAGGTPHSETPAPLVNRMPPDTSFGDQVGSGDAGKLSMHSTDSSGAGTAAEPGVRTGDSAALGAASDAPAQAYAETQPAASTAARDEVANTSSRPAMPLEASAPTIARSTDELPASAPAAAQPSAPARPRPSPLLLTTLILQRHSALGQLATGGDMLFVRTKSPRPVSGTPPAGLRRHASGDAPSAEAAANHGAPTQLRSIIRRQDDSAAVFAPPSHETAIARAAIQAPPLASLPAQPASAPQPTTPFSADGPGEAGANGGNQRLEWDSLPIIRRAVERYTAPGLIDIAPMHASRIFRSPLLRGALGSREGDLASLIASRSASQPAAAAPLQRSHMQSDAAFPLSTSAPSAEIYAASEDMPAAWLGSASDTPGDLEFGPALPVPFAGARGAPANGTLAATSRVGRAYDLVGPPAAGTLAATSRVGRAYELANPPALDLVQTQRAEIQRAATESQPGPAAPAPADSSAAAQAGPNIEELAQKVYEQLRRRLLIDQERRGRSY